tara:strand:+ start:240 stop:791 length:552 start_codon:yes stop_codon:yes gene_type:complete
MKKYLIIIIYFSFIPYCFSSIKENIIINLKDINNISFKFEQNINGNIENGNCIIKYPKKIFCKYINKKNKILVSNGNSLVIKDNTGSYYRYALEKTPLNFILNKKFLINEIENLDERIIDNKYVNYLLLIDDNEINIFFDKRSFNLIGWQILDIYQNLNITFLSSITKNQKVDEKIFTLPLPD